MIVYIGGVKGGSGKSLQSMIAMNHFIENKMNPVLIETDPHIPDVYMSYTDSKDCPKEGCSAAYAFDISTEKGWELTLNAMGETLGKNRETPIVINSAAGNTTSITSYGEVLNDFGVDFITLWVINQHDSGLKQLDDYLECIKQKVCVIRNGFFAKDEDFKAFEKSDYAKNGLRSVYLNKATVSTINALYKEHKAIHELEGYLNFGERMLYKSWIKKANATFIEALQIASIYEG